MSELNDKRKDAIGVLLSTYGEKAPFEIKDLVEEALSNLIDYYETKEFRDLNEDNHIRRDKTLTNLKELWKSWAKLTVGVEPKYHDTVASHFDLLYSTLNYNNASERKRRIKNILIALEDVYNILSEMLEIDRIIYLDDYISKTDEMNPLNHIKLSLIHIFTILFVFWAGILLFSP